MWASPLSRYFIPTERGVSFSVCKLGLAEKPNDYDDMFTLNQGFKGYSLLRHLGDLSFPLVLSFLSGNSVR